MVTLLLPSMQLEAARLSAAGRPLRLPRSLVRHPDDGEEIIATVDGFGPQLRKHSERRTSDTEDDLLTGKIEEAVELFRRPSRRRPSRRRKLPDPGSQD